MKLLLMLLLVLALAGCGSAENTLPAIANSVPATGTEIEKSRAHLGSADALVKAAEPRADSGGQALLKAAEGEHGKADEALTAAQGQLANVQHERDQLEGQTKQQQQRAEAAEGRESALLHSWGHRLQVFVTGIFWLLVGLALAHFAFGALGLMVSGPAGAVFAGIGAASNPLAWFQWLRDHIYYKHVAANAAAITPGLSVRPMG